MFFVRIVVVLVIGIVGWFGINLLGFVVEVVVLVFGLVVVFLFLMIIMGIFFKWIFKEGVIVGMLFGFGFMFFYIVYFKFVVLEMNLVEYWFFGILLEGIGVLGMVFNFGMVFFVSYLIKLFFVWICKLVDWIWLFIEVMLVC